MLSGRARVRPLSADSPRAKETILDSRLDLACEFISHGVPVFIAKPVPMNWSGRTEYFYPNDWPYLDASTRHLEGWKPNYAVCAVTGIKFDVLDVDPRNGGDTMELGLRSAHMMPPARAVVATPSGGTHYYINRTHFRKHTPLPGIDLQAGHDGGVGRGFVFIPPTRRKGKLYQLTQGFNWEALSQSDESPEYARFVDKLSMHYDFTEKEQTVSGVRMQLGDDDMLDLLERVYEIAQNIKEAKHGTRDITINKQCYTIGGLIAGSDLDNEDEQKIVKILQDATAEWDISQSERDHWVTPKILAGIEQGKQFPILGGF